MPDLLRPYYVSLLLIVFCCSAPLKAYQKAPENQQWHLVQSGETLFSLANAYNTTIPALKLWNNLTSNTIQVGEKIQVGENSTVVANHEGAALYHALAKALSNLNTEYKNSIAQANEQPIVNLDALFSESLVPDAYHSAQTQIIQSKIKQLGADLGLKASFNFTQNLEPGILNAEEPFFDNRISTGLSWELLNGGMLGNKVKQDELRKEMSIHQYKKQLELRDLNYSYWYNYLIYSFNAARIDRNKRHIQLLDQYLEIAAKLYYFRAIGWDEIIALKSEKQVLEASNTSLKEYNQTFQAQYDFPSQIITEAYHLPVLKVDFTQLIKEVSRDSVDQKILSLERERLTLQSHWMKDVSLKAGVNYNILNGSNDGATRSFGAVSLSISAPLFGKRHDTELQEAKLSSIEQEQKASVEGRQNELYNLHYEYAYAIRQYHQFQGKVLNLTERINHEEVEWLLNSDQEGLLTHVRLLNERMKVDAEILDIKQKMYLTLLKMYTLSKATTLSDFTQSMPGLEPKSSTGSRAVYLWSDTQQRIAAPVIMQYLRKNEFNTIMLSAGQQPAELLPLAHKAGLTVYRLIGENSYALKGLTPSLTQKLSSLHPLYAGVHMDVEPHTLPEWESDSVALLQRTIATFREIKALLPGKQLSISIPVYYPNWALVQLASVADELVVMAYGTTDLEKIKTRTAEELALKGAKLTIALRATDFNHRLKLEALMSQLFELPGISGVAIHDLGDLVQLDQKTILGDFK